jgi:alkylation response protein AidB-like acyl-CoA dehydrogenase
MDFRPDPDLDAFRTMVRDFLAQKLPADLAHVPRGMASARREMTAWQTILYRQGWGAPSWAKKDGGTGWSVEQLIVFDEECALAGAPTQDGFAHKLLGPVLNHFGTPEQKRKHGLPILAGERLWCQGFSEPGSGSDLASLRLRAERQDDVYVLNGQKTWSTNAHRADWMFVLARTDTDAKRHAGISFILVDLKTPGITVRPIISIDGRHHLNETFFDDVRAPVRNLLGGEGMGWSITKFLLNNEHATTAELPTLLAYLRRMFQLATKEQYFGEPLIERPEFALKIARFEAELMAIEIMVKRAAALHGDQGHFAHALGSMLKIRATELQQRVSLFLVEMLGDHGAIAYPGPSELPFALHGLPGEDFAAGIAGDMFFRRASTIYGGTSEVQRGIVAKLMFGF